MATIKAQRSRIQRAIIAGIGLMVLAWLADAAIDAYFDGDSFWVQALTPSSHEIWIRLLFLCAQFAFIIYIVRLFRRHGDLEEALAMTSLQADAERAKAEAILEEIGDGISIQDLELRVLYQNRKHRELMGDRRGEFCYQAYQGREEVCPSCHLVQSFQDGRTHRREARAPRGDSWVDSEIVCTPLRDAGGRIVAGIEAVRDITERKRIEALLQLQRTAMESASDGMAILDGEGRYVYLNQAHATIYGYPDSAEIFGQSWRCLYAPEEAQRLEQVALPGCRDKGAWRGEAMGLRRDGSLFPQEVSLTGLADGGLVCVVRDISERKQAENDIREANLDLERRAAELAAANRELEAFSYSLSHDIRSYLTRISLAAQTLEVVQPPAVRSEGAYCLRTVQDASTGMEKLIEAMLTLSQVTRRELRREQVDLSALAEEISAELRGGDLKRQIEISIAPDLVAEGDRQLLRVALENLLGNAWKYTRDRQPARIEFLRQPQQQGAPFVIRDNGIGLDPTDSKPLFQPFHRLPNAQGFPGTGIGLATVQRIIARHGGTLAAEGSPGKGASFSFTLP